jgi:hypothetical protein
MQTKARLQGGADTLMIAMKPPDGGGPPPTTVGTPEPFILPPVARPEVQSGRQIILAFLILLIVALACYWGA